MKTLRIFVLQKVKCSKLADLSCDDKKLSVADIFKKTNTLHVSLRCEGDDLTTSEKATAFQRKLVLWREHFGNRCLEMF